MRRKELSVVKDFSRYPFGRYRKDSPYAGEAFRDDLLIPALREFDEVVVVLDGTAGFGSSFLEEAFGGLIRNGFTSDQVSAKLKLISEKDPSYIQEIWDYVHASNS